jgi:hypothetical protein
MKWAVIAAMDQTIGYLSAVHPDGLELTTKHPEALLFERREDAQAIVNKDRADYVAAGRDPDMAADVYAVEDEAEFRSREDTW